MLLRMWRRVCCAASAGAGGVALVVAVTRGARRGRIWSHVWRREREGPIAGSLCVGSVASVQRPLRLGVQYTPLCAGVLRGWLPR